MKQLLLSLVASLTLVLGLFLALPSFAVVEGYKYQFDTLEETQRFVHLNETLRCPKCQNQNLADSNSPIASDMRQKIYELMLDGQTNEEITQYMVDRYGEFVRYKPSFNPETLMLWFGPGLMLMFGVILLIAIRNNLNRTKDVEPLSDAEREKIAELKDRAKL